MSIGFLVNKDIALFEISVISSSSVVSKLDGLVLKKFK